MKQPMLGTMGNITSSSPPPFIANKWGTVWISRRRDPDQVFFLNRSGCRTPLRGYSENGSSQTRGSRTHEWERDHTVIANTWIAQAKDTREGEGKRTSGTGFHTHSQQPSTATSSEQDHAPSDKNHRNDRNHLPQSRILWSYRKIHESASSEQDREYVIHK